MLDKTHIKRVKKKKKSFSGVRKKVKKSMASIVWERIRARGEGRIWIYEDFSDLEFSLVSMALSRLSKKGILSRVRPGVYYFPKKTVFGQSIPNPEEVLESILRKKNIQKLTAGLDILNKLKISDQVSGIYTIAVDRRLSVAISGIKVRALKRPLREQEGITEEERAILDACRNVRRIPNTDASVVIKRIKELVSIRKLNINRLMHYARYEPPRVRALIGSIAEDLAGIRITVDKLALKGLKNSLNPLTYYKFGNSVKCKLNSAEAWHIL